MKCFRISFKFLAVWLGILFSNTLFAQSNSFQVLAIDDETQLQSVTGPSEFDNHSSDFVKSPADADPEYEDTEFGELLYNEASLPTRLEILRLISKETPSTLVFLHALSMGLGIEDVLEAATRYEPNRGREFAQSAMALLPLMPGTSNYVYTDYQLDDLERDDENQPYSVAQVAERFFEDRSVLVPYPDWFEGQSHFFASASELKEILDENDAERKDTDPKEVKWYRNRSDESISKDRPIFISLYESDKRILIDNRERIESALTDQGSDATLPVVFIYNRLSERAIDLLGYENSIRGVQRAYVENSLMVTPAPEWQIGEYNIVGQFEEFYDLFELPEEVDFEPEHWRLLLEEAENYKVNETSFLIVVLSSGDEDELAQSFKRSYVTAAWDDPRTESKFLYTPANGDAVDLKAIMSNGLILNRPDLIAALNALGVTEAPVAFYYIDNARMKPYSKGPRALAAFAEGITVPTTTTSGGFGPPPPPPVCASPPCNN